MNLMITGMVRMCYAKIYMSYIQYSFSLILFFKLHCFLAFILMVAIHFYAFHFYIGISPIACFKILIQLLSTIFK